MGPLSPPVQLLEVASQVDARLQAVLDYECQRWNAYDERLGEAISELARITLNGGKRLRAAFCYWAWHGYYDPEKVIANDAGLDPHELIINVGAAFEFLQVFAVIHDDIMDGSDTRRGQRTVHANNSKRLNEMGWRGDSRRFGDGVAILVGDLGHVYADQLTLGISARARQIWDELRVELNLGQYLDIRSAVAGSTDEATSDRVAVFKTALYTIVRPLQVGVSLHQPIDPDLLKQLDHFGRPLGHAFQLRDDALGLLADEKTLGKPVGDDLREGKATRIVAYAIANANPAQAKELAAIGQPDLDADSIARIVEVIDETGALAKNEQRIERLLHEAKESLTKLPLKAEAIEALGALATYVAYRQY